jgi:hypothetical protein
MNPLSLNVKEIPEFWRETLHIIFTLPPKRESTYLRTLSMYKVSFLTDEIQWELQMGILNKRREWNGFTIITCILSWNFSYISMKNYIYIYITGVWTQDFELARQVLCCLIHTYSHLCSGYLETWFVFCLGWPTLPSSYFKASSYCWDDRHDTMSRFFVLRRRLTNFLPRLPGSLIFLISVSQVSWNDRCLSLHPIIGWNGVLWTFYLGWTWIAIFLVSAFQVAKITRF